MFDDMGINALEQQEALYGRTKEKHEIKNIKVSKEDYEKVIEILKREGIEII